MNDRPLFPEPPGNPGGPFPPPRPAVPPAPAPHSQSPAAPLPGGQLPNIQGLPPRPAPAPQPAPGAPLMPPQRTASPAPSAPPVPVYATAPSAQPAPLLPQRPADPLAAAPAPPIRTAPGGSVVNPLKAHFDTIAAEIRKVFVGQDELVLGTLVALYAGGHVLIESVPGLGKTLFVRTLGRVLGCQFGRIQFTSDLMPSDITGAPVFDMKTQEFRFRPGPVFTQLLLADEINRSPAKTHAALLEIMQEYRVTIEGQTHVLERPFLVLATQNPVESEGTYNLPEAQLDRFMFKMKVQYPSHDEETEILRMHTQQEDLYQRLMHAVQTVASPVEIVHAMQQCTRIRVDEKLIQYISALVRKTREWPQFYLGASPRAGIALLQGARTLAAFYGRDYAVPDDVMQLFLPALRHRVILTPEAEVEGRDVDGLLQDLARTVEVPRL